MHLCVGLSLLHAVKVIARAVMSDNPIALVASHFEKIESEANSREFRTVTGIYKGKRITASPHFIMGMAV